jgi:hypothetical protein
MPSVSGRQGAQGPDMWPAPAGTHSYLRTAAMKHRQFPRQMPAPCVGCGLAWPTPTRYCSACGTKIEYVWVCDMPDAELWEPEQLAS